MCLSAATTDTTQKKRPRSSELHGQATAVINSRAETGPWGSCDVGLPSIRLLTCPIVEAPPMALERGLTWRTSPCSNIKERSVRSKPCNEEPRALISIAILLQMTHEVVALVCLRSVSLSLSFSISFFLACFLSTSPLFSMPHPLASINLSLQLPSVIRSFRYPV